MNCAVYRDLKRVLAAESNAYREARFSACYRVIIEFAAQRNVDLQRGRYALEEHYRVCAAIVNLLAPSPVSDVPLYSKRLAA